MQAASNLHDQVRNAFLGEAQNIFDDATAFDAGDNMFDLSVSPSWGRAPYLGRSYRIVG
jgi:hypothetical protein